MKPGEGRSTGAGQAPAAVDGRAPAAGPRLFTAGLAAFAAVALGTSFLLPPEGPAVELCLFKVMTGLPCGGCGLTRATIAISHGDLGRAWRLNPFGFLFYGLALLAVVGPLLRRVAPGLEHWLLAGRRGMYVIGGLFGALLVYGAVRLALILTGRLGWP